MRRYYLQSGLWMSVLTVLIFGGLYVAADLNATAPPSNTLNIDGGFWSDTGTGFASYKISGRSTKIAVGVLAKGVTTTVPCPDFDGDGTVGLPDFLQFVNHFGTSRGGAGYDTRYDLDGNGAIGISDFLQFVNNFGKEVDCASPDLIVESPSVSNNTLTIGQSFTLSATVRNQGNGQSAATTLRYYRSSDATISISDTEVGTDSVSGLSASDTSVDSISLNAPSSAGTYYYGACVDNVTGESNADNNCSDGVSVTVSSSSGGGGGATVTIADANLRAVIADSLGKASGAPITRDEMATLTRLDAPNKGIRSLTGLEHANNLQWLDLGLGRASSNSNAISDLSPLSNLTNLTYLNLDDNSISDISALSNLTNLTELYLWYNNISDISVLSNLTNLTRLNLDGHRISDISVLSNLTNLTELSLGQNGISDISVLSNLTNLTELGLWYNNISDISVLSNLTNLTVLRLQNNNISDISPLVANTGLGSRDTVNVKSNPLSSASINTHIPALQSRGVTVEFDSSSGSGGGGGGSGGNTVPSTPALSAWINATGSEAQRLLDQATICRAGLEFPRDTFCVNAQQTRLVGHLNSGEGLVLLGRTVFRAGEGGAIRYSGIVLESRGNVWVLTEFSP